ncbi:MAG: Gx transporter family protein [Bacilli bacterium]|nr:Gx transporter family protein [Bacilli bacterium]MDD4547963.1 Gx transporter family protein [Bacilli bacterium]
MELKQNIRLSMLLALSVVLSIIESMIPFFNGYIPGLKLGLANTIILFILYSYSFKDAMYVSVLRVFLVGILRTGIFSQTFFFSLSGALLSGTAMYLTKRFTKLSIVGVSVVGSIFHSVGQVLVAIIIINTTNMIYYLPWLLLFSIPTGIIVGLISKEIVIYFEKELQN